MTLGLIHMGLNHFPFVALFFIALHLGWAMYAKDDRQVGIGLWLLILAAAMTVPVYVTGWGANDLIMEHITAESRRLITLHQDAAGVPFTLVLLLAAIAAGGLLYHRKYKRWPRLLFSGTCLLIAVTLVSLGYISHLGGQIRHTEIRAGYSRAAGFSADDDWDRFKVPPPLDAAEGAIGAAGKSN